MFNEGREDRREFEKLRLRFQSIEEQVEATLRDLRLKQAATLAAMVKLRAKGKTTKLEKAADEYGHSVAREVQLTEELANVRARVAKIESDIIASEQLEAELDNAGQ